MTVAHIAPHFTALVDANDYDATQTHPPLQTKTPHESHTLCDDFHIRHTSQTDDTIVYATHHNTADTADHAANHTLSEHDVEQLLRFVRDSESTYLTSAEFYSHPCYTILSSLTPESLVCIALSSYDDELCRVVRGITDGLLSTPYNGHTVLGDHIDADPGISTVPPVPRLNSTNAECLDWSQGDLRSVGVAMQPEMPHHDSPVHLYPISMIQHGPSPILLNAMKPSTASDSSDQASPRSLTDSTATASSDASKRALVIYDMFSDDLVLRRDTTIYDQYLQSRGHSTLHIACLRGHFHIASALVRAGADIDSRTNFGFTPLMVAASQDDIDLVLFLCCEGVDVNLRDSIGRTALDVTSNPTVMSILRAANATTDVYDVHFQRCCFPIDDVERCFQCLGLEYVNAHVFDRPALTLTCDTAECVPAAFHELITASLSRRFTGV